MSQKFEKLKTLLKELFQLDQPDLDFGLYRIMHAKSAEVTQFLDKDLLPQVQQAFSLYKTADKAELEKELAKAIEQSQSLGAVPDSVPKVKELRAKLANDAVDIGTLENEVYDHLFSFFRRYYSEGDFLAKRVYRPGVYAIPYEGEEVKLHWANHDQYYIKTSEYLRDYAFRLKPDNAAKPMRVHFRLVDATEGEHGNVKATEGKDRAFILASENFIAEEDDELVLRFAYRPATLTDWPESEREGKKKPPAQKDLTASAVSRILAVTDAAFTSWIAELAKPHVNLNGEAPGYSRIEGHLKRYTARNTYDYFIHKDLGGFLRRELDFYVKNEVMHLDDIESDTAPRVEQYLSKIRVIRRIAGKVIDFLAQLEDFQKKLWLKKKFVVETSYCITLGRIPEEFYPEIAANDSQREEWVRLLSIDEITGGRGSPAYSSPLSKEFLAAQPSLMIDTRNFTNDFCARLLEKLDSVATGVSSYLVRGDNFQALSLLQRTWRRSFDCIYIDPPYNAKSSEILYKNDYKHSTWLTLMDDRLSKSQTLLKTNGVFVCAIDEVEQERLGQLLSSHFSEYVKDCIVINHNPSGQQGDNFSYTHEYAYFMRPHPGRFIAEQPREDPADWDERNFRDVTGEESLRSAGKNCFYSILVRNNKVVGFGDVCAPDYHPAINEKVDEETIAVYPIDPNGVERKWRFARDTVETILNELKPHALGYRGVIDIKRTKKTFNYKSNWIDARYSANNHGTQLLNNIIPNAPASYPKSLYTERDCIHAALNGNTSGFVLDYFAGSGTTGHAVIVLNREDGGSRRSILVEVGDHFESVLVPRMKKIAYAPDWREGKARRSASRLELERGPSIYKIICLESYEDTLNNLVPRRSARQDDLLASAEAQGPDRLKEQYMLRYMLDVETRGSQSLLNVKAFADPTAYKLKVKRSGSDESREVNVDLLETFNWLIGLTVQGIAAPQTFTAEFERDTEGRLNIKGRLRQDPTGTWWFRTVTGTTPDGRRALIIWRKLTGNPEQDNLVLDTWFRKSDLSTKDSDFGTIYVNGDNNLPNIQRDDELWKVRLIEEDFHRLMFDTEDL